MNTWDAFALDEGVPDVVAHLRRLSDLARDTAMKWNKVYNSAWHEAENLQNANRTCGGCQGCPLQNARCAAAAANLRYKSTLHIAMAFMSFTLQGVQSLKANLGQLTHLLQELLSGKLPGGDCFMEEYGAQVQHLLARIESFKRTVMGGMNPQAVTLNGDGEMRKYQFSHKPDLATSQVEVVKGLQEQEMEMDTTFRKRGFDGSFMSMEDECRSFQHQEKRRKQR